jgi:hypothetical protein
MAEYALVGTCGLDFKIFESAQSKHLPILFLSGWKIVLTLSALPIPLFALQN